MITLLRDAWGVFPSLLVVEVQSIVKPTSGNKGHGITKYDPTITGKCATQNLKTCAILVYGHVDISWPY